MNKPTILTTQNFHKNFRAMENSKLVNKVCLPVEQYDVASFQQKFGNSFGFSTQFQNFIVENPDTTPRVVGVHGNNYGLVPNVEICQKVMDELDSNFGKSSYFMKVRQFDGRQFEIDFVLDNIVTLVTKDDELYTKITVQNSYDGVLKLQKSVSSYRLVCSNGLMAFANEFDSLNKHTNGFSFHVSDIQKSLNKRIEIVEKFKQMSERTLTTLELEKAMEKISTISPQMPKKLVQEAFLATIENESLMLNVKPNLWLAYNSANKIINHELNKASHTPAFKEKLDKQVLNYLESEFAYN